MVIMEIKRNIIIAAARATAQKSKTEYRDDIFFQSSNPIAETQLSALVAASPGWLDDATRRCIA